MSDTRLTRFMALAEQLARDGAPLPTHEALADALGLGSAVLSRILADAERLGLIRLYYRPGGMRRIEVLTIGASTGWNHNPREPRRRRPAGGGGQPPAGEVQQAKLYLQRRGYPVYAAQVIGGAKARWVVGGPGREYTDQQLVAFARSRGWKACEGRAA